MSDEAVHPGWERRDAVALLCEPTSFHVWDDLVNDAGMTSERYVQLVTGVVLAGLAAPPDRA